MFEIHYFTADKKVKLFISHCGLFGLFEAINHGVPVLGMPVFHDQPMNCLLMQEAQLGLSLNYRKIDENLLRNSIQTILTTNRYLDIVKL